MAKLTSVLNPAGDYEETLERYAKHLGTNKIRRRVFNEIYGRTKKPRSKKEIMEAAGIEKSGNKSQQVQNALEHLSKHRLIERYENNGHTRDGSRFVYGKEEEFTRANKDKIIRYADNPHAANKLPTKRRSGSQKTGSIKQVTKRDLKKKEHLNILYLTASPDEKAHLRVDVEVKRVQEAIRGSKFNDSVTVRHRPAANLTSLIDGLNDHSPQIVHFSGHGNEDEIATDAGEIGRPSTRALPFSLLASALAATDKPPQVIVLNSCESSAAKKALLPNAKVIITMKTSISDIAASAFATHFYAAIAAGQSVKSAHKQGKVAVEAISISEVDTPEIHCVPNVNPAKITLT